MSDLYNNDSLYESEDGIDDLIRELKSEMNAANELEAPPQEEFRDQEYRDTFDEYFEQAFEETEAETAPRTLPEPEEEPEDEAVQEEEAPPAEKKKNFFQRRRERRRRKRKDSLALAIFGNIIYFALVAAVAIMIAKFAWLCADDVLALTKEDSVATVTVQEGDNLNKITQNLYDAGLINYPWLFKIYGDFSHVEDKVRPGVYELNTLFDYHALVNGMQGSYNRMTTTVTIIEGKTSAEIFQTLEEAGICSAADLANAAANMDFDYEFLDDLEKGTPNRLEGYLFPDTYEFYLADDPENVIDKFLSNFDNRMDETLMARVATSGYSLHEIISIAAMIQEEAASVDEASAIASVIYNRLNLSSDAYERRLQMDSTVFYAAELMGTDFDTELDSPYNTYMYPGIPAGPIDNPGLDAIQAALYPDDTDYYYFAFGKDGVSHFFRDFDSHAAFVASDEYVG